MRLGTDPTQLLGERTGWDSRTAAPGAASRATPVRTDPVAAPLSQRGISSFRKVYHAARFGKGGERLRDSAPLALRSLSSPSTFGRPPCPPLQRRGSPPLRPRGPHRARERS